MLDHLVLLTTTRCNLRCGHCLRGYDQPAQDFPLELLPRLLNDARLYGAHHVALTGGEPGLHPCFAELVALLVKTGYTWHFVSNGLRTDLYLPAIEANPSSLTAVALSLDGGKPETHNAVRGRPEAFERLLQAAQTYRDRGIPVRLAVTLNRLNKEEIPRMLALAEEWGVRRMNIAAVIPTPWNGDLALSENERAELYLSIQEIKQTVKLNIRTLSSLHTRGGVYFCNNLGLREVVIDSAGSMLFCCDLVEGGTPLGSLYEQSLPLLMEKWLETSAWLQRERVRRIAAGDMPEGFDGCAFCGEPNLIIRRG